MCRLKRCLAKATVVSLESKPWSRSTKALQGKIQSDPEDMDDLGVSVCMAIHNVLCEIRASSGYLGATKIHWPNGVRKRLALPWYFCLQKLRNRPKAWESLLCNWNGQISKKKKMKKKKKKNKNVLTQQYVVVHLGFMRGCIARWISHSQLSGIPEPI